MHYRTVLYAGPDNPVETETFGHSEIVLPDCPLGGPDSSVVQFLHTHQNYSLDGPDSPVGRPDSPVVQILHHLLPSSLPSFSRGRCRRTLALALLLVIRGAPMIPINAHERSVK